MPFAADSRGHMTEADPEQSLVEVVSSEGGLDLLVELGETFHARSTLTPRRFSSR
jgi:hypothetical protein